MRYDARAYARRLARDEAECRLAMDIAAGLVSADMGIRERERALLEREREIVQRRVEIGIPHSLKR